MIGLLSLLKDTSAIYQIKEIKEHLHKLEKELNEISKILNKLSYDINEYLDIILKTKSSTILNEKKLQFLENEFIKL